MGDAVDQARQERELTKQQLTENLDRFEARVRAELDWRARLRRHGARYAITAAGAIVLIGALLVLRAKLRGHDEQPAVRVSSLEDIAAELEALHAEMARMHKRKDQQPLWQKAALKAVTTAAAAAGTMAARSMMERFAGGADAAEPE